MSNDKILLKFKKKNKKRFVFNGETVLVKPYIEYPEIKTIIDMSIGKLGVENDFDGILTLDDIYTARACADLYLIQLLTNVNLENVEYEEALQSGLITLVKSKIDNIKEFESVFDSYLNVLNNQMLLNGILKGVPNLEELDLLSQKVVKDFNDVDKDKVDKILQHDIVSKVAKQSVKG